MSSERKTFRIPLDAYQGLQDMVEDREINEHKAGVRCLEAGLERYGYGDFGASEGWVGEALGEIGKVLAYMGVAFLAASPVAPAVVLWWAVGCLGASALMLLGERNEEFVKGILGLPDRPPWEEAATAGGGGE